jgi:nucleoid DNA-binding protein
MAINDRYIDYLRGLNLGPSITGMRTAGAGRTPMTMGASARYSRISVEEQARRLADQIVAERDRERRMSRLGKIYTRFDEVDDVLSNNVETVTRGLFSGNVASLTNFGKLSLTAEQLRYYYNITDSAGGTQLSIAFGHFHGSGSLSTVPDNLNNDQPARAIYKQYAQTLLAPADKKFTFNNIDSDSIYVLNFNRARIREKLDPGNFEITLRDVTVNGSGVSSVASTKHVQIIDDSSLTSATLGESGQIYNLVSGSLDDGTGIYNASSPVYFGLLYPQHGVAILDGTQLDKSFAAGGADFATVDTSGVEGYNIERLYAAMSSSAGAVPAGKTGGIQARSAENVKSTYYFVRAKNAEFNYSNNPSFVTGDLGQLAFNSFKNDPQVYITSIGLYNDRRELLAVAKLSQPLLKNYTREALIKVKLDF